ncbi:MAG: ferric reductase-like transmembrane domain-containing protein [Rhodoferax sp.]|uniref:ferredoxin reductase family protein n=1 Tax=Rhodoferax sp. TaxID=50421 RepID=UPI002619ECD0|nr:ferric reductase-like transmembrane domain-containing protein [Rhodoferax sp.]MDD2882439.1 ferric reductase-like transmembrane domain-containing protein [Rhodoferax sp.]
MKRIKQFFWLFLFGLASLWFLTDTTVWANLSGVFDWRNVLVQFSGVLGIGIMSVAMLLAVRPVWFESALGGLDKMYRLHKWLGIAGLALSVMHWLAANGPKWLVGWGWLERPVRGPRAVLPADEVIRQFFMDQRGLAEGLAEWAFYAAALLMVLALIKRFPYRYFLKVHHLLAVTYLVLVWHAVVLLKFEAWGSVLGLVMAVLMLSGSVAAVLVLLGRTAKRRQLAGEVVGIRQHTALQVVEVDVALQGPWAGHSAGQFAFVTLHEKEGAHPYTISSAWANNGRLTFIIKALGDYTNTLADTVRLKDKVKVEGPYGRFDFQSTQARQIWVAGGIGITPFVARMKALALMPDGKTVDLFHATSVLDPQVMALMAQDAKAADVNLHLLHSPQDGHLDAAHIVARVPDWRASDIWFCGPARFGQALKESFKTMGLPEARFHQELFEMR